MYKRVGRKRWYEGHIYLYEDGYCHNIFTTILDRGKYVEGILRPYKSLLAGSIYRTSKNVFNLVCIFTYGSQIRTFKTIKECLNYLYKSLKK